MYYRINRWGADEPPVESLAAFGVPDSDVPQAVRERFQPWQRTLADLGFGSAVWLAFSDPVNGGEAYVAVLLHDSGRALARLWCRTTPGVPSPNQPFAATFLSAFEDGTYLVSSPNPSDVATPPGLEINQLVGAGLPELWASHGRKLALGGKKVATMASSQQVLGILEGHHRRVRDFYLQHAIFELPGPVATVTPAVANPPQGTSAYGAYAPVLYEIERQQKRSGGWGKMILILGVSLMLFFGVGAAAWDRRMLLMLVPILLFHEFGHYVAMRAFGYRDLRMFFIPLFGAAVTGRNYNVPGWKKAIVSLAGPVPGILLGVALGAVALALGTRWLMEAAGLMILLNGFNLLPFLPLDGGWVAHAILFSRRPWLDAGFRILAAVALILGGLALGTRMLPLIGVFLLFGVPLAFRVARVAASVRRDDLPTDAACDKIPAETACRIIDALRGSVPKSVGDKQLASLTLQVYETANARPPGWLATLAFGAVHAGSFLLAVVAPVALLFASGFGWRHPGERTVAEPRHALNVELIRSFPSPAAAPSPGDARVTVIATFPTVEAAGGAVPAIASQLPDPHRLKLFGQTLILELPARADRSRVACVGRLRSQKAEVLVSSHTLETEFAVACAAPDENVAAAIESEVRQYFWIPLNWHVIPPWSPELVLSPQQYIARSTYERLSRGPDLPNDPVLQRLGGQMGDARNASDQDSVKQLAEQYQQQVKDLQKEYYQHLRALGEAQVDVPLIDLFENRPEFEAELQAAVDREDAVREFAARQQQWNQQWNLAAGVRLGQLPLIDGQPQPGTDRFSASGVITRQSLQLRFSGVAFVRPYDGPQALAVWLRRRGCASFRYGFGGDQAGAPALHDERE